MPRRPAPFSRPNREIVHMANRYTPPTQSGVGQFFDSVFLMALVYAALFLPIILGLTGGETERVLPEGVTITESADGTAVWEGLSWEALGQNAAMQAQWEKLGYDVQSAADLITTRFDYEFRLLPFLITAAGIIGYFIFMLVMSEREYRDVIAERFGNR